MKKLYFFILLFILCGSAAQSKFVYLDPLPGANYISIYNNIILGSDVLITSSDVSSTRLIVNGSLSGLHAGKLILSPDNKHLIFKVDIPFQPRETVTVNLASTLLFSVNNKRSLSYSFQTEAEHIAWQPGRSLAEEKEELPASYSNFPVDLPNLNVSVSNNPAPGKIFIANYPNGRDFYMIISENTGTPLHFIKHRAPVLDFKVQDNGHITYIDEDTPKFFEMDENYTVVDSFYCGNGYVTDVHDLRILPNHHALLLSYDPQSVGGGGTLNRGGGAIVIGLIIQEIDENKNVIFQWRSWDHFQVTDATHENLAGDHIDYVHGNSIEVDSDNNLILSARHMDEITKINRITGEIIWRFGGKHNQFTFINDTLGFSHQHAVRRIPNGHITLFDNGNFHNPSFSRAVEYELDEVNKTATLVWQYRHSPEIYGKAMGYVQRLANGNTLISWGLTNPSLTEVTPEGNIALEMDMPQNIYSYRAFKFDWKSTGINLESGVIPQDFKLAQNYPNPFNPATKIKFDIPDDNVILSGAKNPFVKLTVYNSLGKQIALLVNESLQPGSYSYTFDASQLAAGVYFYKLQAGSFSETRKMLLIK